MKGSVGTVHVLCTVLLYTVQQASAKLCWEECTDLGVVQNVDIHGCRRRSSYPLQQDFKCNGRTGPPCTTLRGDTVYLDLHWKDEGHQNITQNVVWQSGFFDLPWVGMETEICKYTNGGQGCPGSGENGVSNVQFPIQILDMYPAGKYNLKWEILDRTSEGSKTLACFLITVKIM
ncbi:uncharacterized protein LOC111696425 [Eurytemora carolleeae]|uniref:uncharacterized protein LOC111696425 n=1 Tax=Eurytemora carolleeae TaxID=1294199 RepID=UPI000C790C02|nr:uncharacterized protein LOC111696425 [Eurytemora carolleeae]|eukprot:XP_023321795.1 uncharacterized protein LOC111696425 [Eurytemora affinis]